MKEKILKWANSLMIPQDKLDGMPICPFAKKAITDDEVDIHIYENNIRNIVYFIIELIKNWKEDKKLIIVALPMHIPHNYLLWVSKNLMATSPNIIVLVGHPEKPTIINEITTTFQECPLVFIQKRDYLKNATEMLKKTNYYSFWTEEQIENILNCRE